MLTIFTFRLTHVIIIFKPFERESDKNEIENTIDIILCALFAASMGIGRRSTLSQLAVYRLHFNYYLPLWQVVYWGVDLSILYDGVYLYWTCRGSCFCRIQRRYGYSRKSYIRIYYFIYFRCLYRWKVYRERGRNYIAAGFLVIVMNYVIGTNLMYVAMKFWAAAPEGFSYGMAWSWMVIYLPLDIVVTVISLTALPKVKAALKLKVQYSMDV